MSPGYQIKQVLNRILPGQLVLHRHGKHGKRLALTFDDGPHPENTGRILEILATRNAKATFFLQGSEADKHPQLVRQVAANGHQVANHGFNHLDCRKVSLDEYVKDIAHSQRTLEDIVGQKLTRIFRPPFGSVTLPTFLRLCRQHYRYVFWSTDSRDSFIKTRDDLRQYVLSLPVTSGDIMLFHEDYKHSTAILDSVITHFQDKGFEFVTIDALIAK